MNAPVALVTGATDGIGRATAAALAARGFGVLVHGRTRPRAEETCAGIGAAAAPVWGDFSRMIEVVALAEQVRARGDDLDVLINNAGVYCKQRGDTVDGFELTMAVNHVAPFLLTAHLLPLLETAAGRIVNVSSMTHEGASIDVDDLDLLRGWSAYGAYATSKLANVLFTRALARRLEHATTNALHPGVIGTKLLRAGFGMGGGSVEDGARTSVWLATAPEVAGTSGAYFADCRKRSPGRRARDDRLGEALWQATERRLREFMPATTTPTERRNP